MLDYINSLLAGVELSTLSISGVRINDIIDIIIVAYFIFKITIWIKQTRAWSLFKGVVVVLILAALSYAFKLYTISWLVNYVFYNGLLAIIILFQPELRKALEQLGRGKLALPFSISDNEKEKSLTIRSAEEIVKAVVAMSKVATGALIVIEREVALGDHENTGIKVDAVITSQLLINIFEKNTPLHDGAVIVRNNRVAAATCILPLTQDEIGRELGTRHRAAVGTSEVCDAIVVVVSEETGGISAAEGGSLYRGLKEKQLKEMLTRGIKTEKRKITLWRGTRSEDAKEDK